jgi:hypothetical protein
MHCTLAGQRLSSTTKVGLIDSRPTRLVRPSVPTKLADATGWARVCAVAIPVAGSGMMAAVTRIAAALNIGCPFETMHFPALVRRAGV